MLVVAGFLLGEQWDKVLDYTEPLQDVVMALLAALLVAIVVRKVVLTRRLRAAEEQAHPGLSDETFEEIVDELAEGGNVDVSDPPTSSGD